MTNYYENGFFWKPESKEIKFKDIQVGDAIIIYFLDKDEEYSSGEGIVLKLGLSLLHEHPYVTVKCVSVKDNEKIYTLRERFYFHRIKKIIRVAKIQEEIRWGKK
jgi:hypothetical protein